MPLVTAAEFPQPRIQLTLIPMKAGGGYPKSASDGAATLLWVRS
jgi:hypothetical protein